MKQGAGFFFPPLFARVEELKHELIFGVCLRMSKKKALREFYLNIGSLKRVRGKKKDAMRAKDILGTYINNLQSEVGVGDFTGISYRNTFLRYILLHSAVPKT